MNFNLVIPFFFGMVILAATPGPGVFASMAKASTAGFVASLYLIAGLAVGDIVFLNLALLGMSAIAKILGPLFLAIKIIGGLYLLYLGVKLYRSREFQAGENADAVEPRYRTFLSGMFVSLGNPKPILFYASVLPTIINFNEVRFVDACVMMLLIASVSFIVVGTYSYFASLTHRRQMDPAMAAKINKIAGLVLIAVGIYVAIH
ncbi:MAG TPA: LysE family translocator [Bacteroidota bacterium]|nr:LysE family translocator [Bacteroidota bacterium]